MADKEFNVRISAETDDFSRGMSRAEGDASGLGDALRGDVTRGANDATESIRETTEELKRLQREAMGARTSMGGIGNAFDNTSGQSNKFNREMQRLSMMLGGDVPESAQKAYKEMMNLHREARTAQRTYGKYSQQALNARDAISKFALGLDDATFKQIYMRSQLGLTDGQLRQQANSIKLNARMTKLMGNQTQILTQRMQGLAKHGIKPEDLLPPSTIGQFQLLNETMAAGRVPINMLSGAYRKFGGVMEKTIKGWSAQKMAIKAAQGDMVKYGILQRGITTGMANMTMALPLVGIGAFYAYKTMFSAAMNANEGLKELSETVKGKLVKAFEPLITVAGEFLEVVLNIVGRIAELVSAFNEAHPAIAKLLGVIGFLLPAMTLLLLPIGLGIGLFKGWAVVINGAWTMLGGLLSMIGVASSTFLALAAVVGIVVVAFMHLWKTNEGFRDACIAIWEAIKSAIQNALENIQQWFMTHADTIKTILQIAYETVKTIITTVLEAIKEIVGVILDNIKQFWDEHGENVKQAVKVIYETVSQIIKSILDTIKQIIKVVLDAIKEFWDKHGEAILKIAKSAWDLIKSAIQSVLDIIKSIINGVCAAINGDWDTFWQEVGNIAGTAWEFIKEVVKTGISAIPGIISAAVGLVTSAIKGVFDAGVKVAEGFISTMLNVGKDLIAGLAKGITSGISSVVNAVTGVVKKAISAGKKLLGINSPSKLFMQFGEWTTEGYEIGINRGEPASTRAVENFAEQSINGFTENHSLNSTINESSLSSNVSNNSNIDYNKMYEVMVGAFTKAIENTGMDKPEFNVDGRNLFNAISPHMGKAVRGL